MQTIERLIISALLRDMRAAGYQPAAVWNDGEYVVGRLLTGKSDSLHAGSRDAVMSHIERPLTDAEALEHVDSVDCSTLHFTRQNATTWGDRGVFIVLGNGEDCLSDYHCPKGEPFVSVIESLSGRLERGELL